MQDSILISAHRGNSAYFPENTMVSFESALSIPVDMLEFDLHMTKDKQIILMHDQMVDRTTNGTGLIRDLTLAEIQALDAGEWKNQQFKGTRVPTFEEFLSVMEKHPDIGLCVELKDYPKDGREWAFESADKSIELIEKHGLSEQAVINSFSGELLEYIDEKYMHRYKLHGYYPLELLGENIQRDPYDYLYCICMFGTKEQPISPQKAFDYAVERNVKPWVYYSDDSQKSYDVSIAYGAQLITANDPRKALSYLQKKGLHK